MKQQNVKKKVKIFSSIDEAYRETFPKLVSIARSHLYNRDDAIDVAHDAFVKALENIADNPGRELQISYFILVRTVLRLCRKYNKRISIEVPYDFRAQERSAAALAESMFKKTD